MQLIIKAAEVWLPDSSGRFLALGSSHYGALHEFESASKSLAFAFGEGLPGQTWERRTPLLWRDLSSEHFQRTELAQQAGIECGLSIPIICGEFLLAVVVLFCSNGETDQACGAIEIWGNLDHNPNELKLCDGYYGHLEQFEWLSRRLTIMRGRGLPGLAWDNNQPVIMNNLTQSTTFLRSRAAADCGLNTGLSIPFFTDDKQVQVVTFLSNNAAPIASRFEIWVPDPHHECLIFQSGYCADAGELNEHYTNRSYAKGHGVLGEVWLTGRPLIAETTLSQDERALYLPLNDNGMLTAVIVFVL